MKTEEQIEALAELDGWTYLGQDAEWQKHWIQFPREVISKLSHEEVRKQRVWRLPDYLTCFDAIIPLVQKQALGSEKHEWEFINALNKIICTGFHCVRTTAFTPLAATPDQLCEALLRATGKWKE